MEDGTRRRPRRVRRRPPTGSVAPAPQGLVAFAAQSRGSSTGLVIAVMQPNGTGFRQLTGLPGDRDADPDIARYTFASDDSPSFSPDGRTIAFVRRYTEGLNSLCKINVDGSNFRVDQARCADGRDRVVARRSHDRLLFRAGRRDPSDRRRRYERTSSLAAHGRSQPGRPLVVASTARSSITRSGDLGGPGGRKRVASSRRSSARRRLGGPLSRGLPDRVRRTRIDGRRRCDLAGGPRWIEPSASHACRER